MPIEVQAQRSSSTTMANSVEPTSRRAPRKTPRIFWFALIVCGLFASLMSTVDSIFHSVSTLWSIDVYKRHLRPTASPEAVVRMGKSAIVGALGTGLLFAFLVVYLKTGSLQDDPLTHWFNELSYYVKNGFVVLVSAAVFLIRRHGGSSSEPCSPAWPCILCSRWSGRR